MRDEIIIHLMEQHIKVVHICSNYCVKKDDLLSRMDNSLSKEMKHIRPEVVWAQIINIKAVISYFYSERQKNQLISTREAFWVNRDLRSDDILYHGLLGRPVDMAAVQDDMLRHMNKINQKFHRLGVKIFGVSA